MLRLFIAVSRLFDKVGTHIELGSRRYCVRNVSWNVTQNRDSTPMICEHMIPPNFFVLSSL